jgi:site-specific recombinase XerD
MPYKFCRSRLPLLTKKPHVLRHTFATHLLNNGAEPTLSKKLGRASFATQVYTHNTIDKQKNLQESTSESLTFSQYFSLTQ